MHNLLKIHEPKVNICAYSIWLMACACNAGKVSLYIKLFTRNFRSPAAVQSLKVYLSMQYFAALQRACCSGVIFSIFFSRAVQSAIPRNPKRESCAAARQVDKDLVAGRKNFDVYIWHGWQETKIRCFRRWLIYAANIHLIAAHCWHRFPQISWPYCIDTPLFN